MINIPASIRQDQKGFSQPEARSILFLTTVNFSEPSGGVVYSRAIHDALATQGKVTMAILSEHQRWTSRSIRWLFASVKSLFTGVPPNVLFHSGNLNLIGKNLIGRKWDLVVIDHLESAFSVAAKNSLVIYVSHNRESGLIRQKMPRAPSWCQRMLASWVEHYEQRLVRNVDAVIAISSDEARWYRSLNSHVAVVPPVFSVPARLDSPANHEYLRLGFLGGAKWPPNLEAMDLLLAHVLPQTRRPLELVIAGGGWDAAKIHHKLQGVGACSRINLKYLGYIDDIATFWSAIDVFAAPVASGAGVNVKVCEALANACPVIALPHALRGLDGIAKDLVCSVATPDDFAHALDAFDATTYPRNAPDSLMPAQAALKIEKLLATISQSFSR